MADCSELARTITDIALHLATRPGMNSIDAVTAEMSKELPGITRDMVVDSIVEATSKQARTISDTAKRVADVKREARADRQLRKTLSQLERHLASQTLPDSTKRTPAAAPETIEQLRTLRADLQRQLRQSEPAVRQRVEKSIDRLEAKLQAIEDGSYVVPVRQQDVPASAALDRLIYQRNLARRQIDRRLDAMKPLTPWGTAWAVGTEPFNVARAMMTSFDFSAVGRQGWFFVVSHPIRSAKALPKMFQALSAAKADKITRDIQDRPNAPLYDRYKLAIVPVDSQAKLTKQEEAYMSRVADRIPGIAASQRAYTTFLNVMRADAFDAFVATLGQRGAVTDVEGRAIAGFVNTATGRGSIGKFDMATEAMNVAFFAPRLVASRFQLLLGQPAWGGTLRTRTLVAGEYARFLIGMGLLYSMIGMAFDDEDDVSVEFDPRSSDFGKIRVGNTRIDPLGGLAQVTVLTSRLYTGQTKSTSTGTIYDLEPGWGKQSRLDVLWRFARTKFSPLVGTFADLLDGENVVGEPVTGKMLASNLLVPLSWQNLYEQIEEHGVPKGTALSLLEMFGWSMQTYEPRTKAPAGPKPPRPPKPPKP